MHIERVLLHCRFSRRYHGYRELMECVKLACEKEERLLYVTGIYSEVGEMFSLSASGVERNIRTMVEYAWKNGGKEQMENLSGGILYEKPTVSEVIEMLVCYLNDGEGRQRKVGL